MAINAAGWMRSIALIALPGLALAGCASSPPDGASSRYPAGHAVGAYRVGVPYQIHGVWYYPAVDYNYDRTGVASWYGEQFEGRLTANGEIFELNDLTAAHTTLPMPSIVQVTNLENGRSLQLRVNDRGPFVGTRLIDVSRRAAQLLGFERQGTTLVRVTILKDESIAAAEEAMHNSGQVMVAQASGGAAAAAPASRPVYASAVAATPAVRRVAALPPPLPPPSKPSVEPPSTPQVAMVPAAAPRRETPAALPQMALASSEPAPPPSPPPHRPPPPPHSLFALIARAEAAELPPARPRAHQSESAAATPSAKMPSSPQRTAAARSGPAGGIFVQAGAFSMRGNAERVQSRIARLGSVQVMPTSVNGVAMYRVRIGPLGNEEQAHRLLARVVDSGYRSARIVGD